MQLSSHLLSISDFRKPSFSQMLTYKLMGFYSVTFLDNISDTWLHKNTMTSQYYLEMVFH